MSMHIHRYSNPQATTVQRRMGTISTYGIVNLDAITYTCKKCGKTKTRIIDPRA